MADFLHAWRALGREAHAVAWNPDAVVLEHPTAVQALPGFDSGAVSVQDCGAQLAAPLLDAQPGMRVLDACAAPGGKTLHIAQRTPDLGELVAVDDDRAAPAAGAREPRARRAQRDCCSRPTCASGRRHWRAGSFDRVLVDAPCSATGVIRRHPDIKLLRRPQDIDGLRRHPAAHSAPRPSNYFAPADV